MISTLLAIEANKATCFAEINHLRQARIISIADKKVEVSIWVRELDTLYPELIVVDHCRDGGLFDRRGFVTTSAILGGTSRVRHDIARQVITTHD